LNSDSAKDNKIEFVANLNYHVRAGLVVPYVDSVDKLSGGTWRFPVNVNNTYVDGGDGSFHFEFTYENRLVGDVVTNSGIIIDSKTGLIAGLYDMPREFGNGPIFGPSEFIVGKKYGTFADTIMWVVDDNHYHNGVEGYIHVIVSSSSREIGPYRWRGFWLPSVGWVDLLHEDGFHSVLSSSMPLGDG
jgi:hypothetical protein